jgi:hypothetical protein
MPCNIALWLSRTRRTRPLKLSIGKTRAQAVACTGPAASPPPIGRLGAERHCFETLDGSGDAPGRVSGAAIHLTNSTSPASPPLSFGNNVGREPPTSATCNGTHETRGDPAASLFAQTAPCPAHPRTSTLPVLGFRPAPPRMTSKK